MKTILLTQGKIALVDDKDFVELSKFKWLFSNRGYAVRTARTNGKKTISMHRQILNANVGQICDHKNRNKIDNRRKNLRFCTSSQNSTNYGSRSKSEFKYRGVHKATNKKLPKPWVARIVHKGKRIYLGFFYSPQEAAKAYNHAAKSLFKEFAYHNKI